MIKLERCNVMNFENAIRGARNPLNSWGRMDSSIVDGKFVFGPNDLDLAKRLCKAGSDHRKFIRQIFITVDITAPLYWWKEYDTYKRKMQPYEEQQATAEQAAIEEQNKKAAENAKQVAEQKQQTEAHRDNMYGISDKDINSVNDTFSAANVRNDKTGNWRISKISENINMEEYALSYYKKYFKSDSEIHWIVNFTLKTTTCISVSGNMLFVDVHEYVDGEEHYADTLGSGMTLSKFHIYTDNGDIEKIQ